MSLMRLYPDPFPSFEGGVRQRQTSVYAGTLRWHEGHTYIILDWSNPRKVSPRNSRFVPKHEIFSLERFPLYGTFLNVFSLYLQNISELVLENLKHNKYTKNVV